MWLEKVNNLRGIIIDPNFFIVGAPKSGTTNISYYLKLSKHVFMPYNLEPYYFARLDIPKKYQREIITGKKKYLDLFKKAKFHKAVGESSPVYLYCPHSAEEIKKEYPNSKIIISLRNPIEIAYSQYYSLKFMNFNNQKDFSQIIDIDEKRIKNKEFFIDSVLEAGFYSKHIKKFQSFFPKENLKIIVFEEYIKNIEPTINSILRFLNIDEPIEYQEQPKGAYKTPKNFFGKLILENSIVRKTAQHIIPTESRQKFGERFLVKETNKPPLNNSERNRLKKIFDDEVKNLEILLGAKLPWPDFN